MDRQVERFRKFQESGERMLPPPSILDLDPICEMGPGRAPVCGEASRPRGAPFQGWFNNSATQENVLV